MAAHTTTARQRDVHWVLSHPIVFLRQTRLGKLLVACAALFAIFLAYRVFCHGVRGFADVHSFADILRAPPGEGVVDGSQLAEQFPLFRDLYEQEAWPEISRGRNVTPDQVPYTVHYVWCGSQEFRFEHYLGVLSVIRLLQPLKIVFHYSELPVIDRLWYHVWFWELKQSFASLELRPLEPKHRSSCGQEAGGRGGGLSDIALDLLSRRGGLYVAPKVVLTRFPNDITRRQQLPFWFSKASEGTVSILFSLRGFNDGTRRGYTEWIRSEEEGLCSSVDVYDKHHQLGGGGGGRSGGGGGGGRGAGSGPPCLLLTNQTRPKDVVTARTPFAELARWLYYGTRKVLEAKQSPTSSIPRIAHVTWLAPHSDTSRRKRKFEFFHFLSVLSALHVAGLRHVYVHGDVQPEGEWWDRLKGENVTYVPIEAISHVFQQSVGEPAHRSDVIRAHLLHSFGGVYMDGDVMWVNRLPDDLLRYPTVACPDWPSRGEWPAAFNIGVLMSQSDSPWLRHFLATMRRYLDWSWYYNGIMMPYRTYERYPESLHIDYHLQVICYKGNCHPAWHDDYIRDLHDPRPPRDFHWREPRAYHFTTPKPPKSLKSPAEIRKRLDIFAEIGHLILTQSGRGWMIGEA